jgi:hypothetical protein
MGRIVRGERKHTLATQSSSTSSDERSPCRLDLGSLSSHQTLAFRTLYDIVIIRRGELAVISPVVLW